MESTEMFEEGYAGEEQLMAGDENFLDDPLCYESVI